MSFSLTPIAIIDRAGSGRRMFTGGKSRAVPRVVAGLMKQP